MNNTAENKPGMLRTAAIYGLYIGLATVVFSLLNKIVGTNAMLSFLLELIKLVTTIGILVYAVKRYRNINNGGFITYGQAFSMGMLTSLVATIVGVVYIIANVMANLESLQADLYNAYIDLIDKGYIEQAAVDIVVDNISWALPVVMTLWYMLLGCIYSLIIAAALVRKKSIFNA